jgi:tetratricopeptide (TPR) repeat protein
MTSNQDDNLQIDELMQLARQAVAASRSDVAIGYLKQVIGRDPANALAHYLLGAVHAGLGMYERAAKEMATAIGLDQDIPPTAYFQLGLLHIARGNIAEAEQVWRALDGRGEDDFLLLFKRGMLHLAADEFEDSIRDLRRGIELNDFNEELNVDMRKMLDRAEAALIQYGAARGQAE